MPPLKQVPLQVAIALDQLANALLGGWADETISSRSHRLAGKSKGWSWAKGCIDTFALALFWQRQHCQKAYESEIKRLHLPPQQRPE